MSPGPARLGDEGSLRKLSFEMRRQQRPGDSMACRGKVTGKYEREGEGWVELDVWAENEMEGVTAPGKAILVLPRRSGLGGRQDSQGTLDGRQCFPRCHLAAPGGQTDVPGREGADARHVRPDLDLGPRVWRALTGDEVGHEC